MKRIPIMVIALCLIASFAWAEAFESVTIAAASTPLTALTYGRAKYALCRLETAEIRYTVDGTTVPSATVGMLMEPFEFIVLETANQIRNFRGYRTTGTSGVLKCFYFD